MNLGIKEVLTVGVPYCIAIGACYLFGYWGSFHINVLEFITFADVAKIAVYPLMTTLVFGLAGYLSADILFAPYYPPKDHSEPKAESWSQKKYLRWLFVLNIVAIVLLAIYASEPTKWFPIALLISLFAIPLSYNQMFVELIPNPRFRLSALIFLLFLPPMSFGYGREQAYFVKTGASELFVDAVRSKLPLTGDAKDPITYIGFLGNVYVLRETKTGQIVFVKQSDDLPLFLVPKQQ